MHADNTCQQARYETYQEGAINKTCLEKTAVPRNIANGGLPNNDVLSQTGTVDAAKGPAVPDAASEKGVPDVAGTTTSNNFNANSPKDGQTSYMTSMKEPEKIAMTAFTSGEGRAGGITKCAPTCVCGNFATLAQLRLLPASDRAACSFDLRSSCDTHTP
jgi:hypothetical protein